MVINTTQWQPDTCDCILEYSWDDSVPADQRVHTPTNSIKCPFHTNQATHSAVYNTVVNENQRKNIGFQTALDNGPTSLFDLQADGSRTLKNNITYSWTWSGTAPNRLLTVTFTGITLTNAQKNAIQTKLNTIFGAGKVILA